MRGNLLYFWACLAVLGLVNALVLSEADAQAVKPSAAPFWDGHAASKHVAKQSAGAAQLGNGSLVQSGITITVRPSPAPNAYGSPSWSGYVTNALNALENNLTAVGNPLTDPTAYRSVTHLHPAELQVTSMNSWRGVYNHPAPFNAEYGTRLHFGLHIVGDGVTQFRLNELEFEMHSGDYGDFLVFTGNFVGFNYSTTRTGIDWGPDRAKGGGDDIVYTSGNGTSPVDEIIYVGVGNAFWPDYMLPPGQGPIDDGILFIRNIGPMDVTTTYTIWDPTHTVILASNSGVARIVSANAMPVDLRGSYIAGSKAVQRGLAAATTASAGTDDATQVAERSTDVSVSPEGTYTPFSDTIKPPKVLDGLDLRNSFFDVFVGLAPPGVWDPDKDMFQFGLGRQPRDSNGNAEVWVTAYRDSGTGNMRFSLQTDAGTFGPSYDVPATESFFDVFCEIDPAGTAMTGVVTPLNGPGHHIANPLGTLALDTVNDDVTSTALFAGFISSSAKSTAKATIPDFTAGRPVDALFNYADDTYVKTSENIHYRFGMANLDQTVSGFQAFLSNPSAGVQGNLDVRTYTDWPFTLHILPFGLGLDGGITLGDDPVRLHSSLADLAFNAPLAEGTAWLKIDADNGNPVIKTRFSDAFGNEVVPFRQDSNVVVVDDTPPTLTGMSASQSHGNVLNGASPTIRGNVTICVDAKDVGPLTNGSGISSQPTISIDFPAGMDVVNAPMYAGPGNTFCYDYNVTDANGCGTAPITINVFDDAGNAATPATGFLDLNTLQIVVDVDLVGSFSTTVTRGIDFVIGGTGGGNSPVPVSKDIVFTNGDGAPVTLTALDTPALNCGSLITHMSAKDPLHTLRQNVALGGSSPNWTASFALKSGDCWGTTPGPDNLVDILDFGKFASKFGLADDANTPVGWPLGTGHPDFSGNGLVGTEDYTFISANFLQVGDSTPGNYGPQPKPKEKCTVKEMQDAGIAIAPIYDLNKDGWVTFSEIAEWLAKTGGNATIKP